MLRVQKFWVIGVEGLGVLGVGSNPTPHTLMLLLNKTLGSLTSGPSLSTPQPLQVGSYAIGQGLEHEDKRL